MRPIGAARKAMEKRMGKVLIVEDERHVARLLGFFLTRAGYEVAEAGDGETALQMMDDFRPDAVVLDLILPKLSGVEVLAAIDARPRLRPMPVIVMTACPDDQIPLEITSRTDIPRFHKPLIPSILLRRLLDLDVPPMIDAA